MARLLRVPEISAGVTEALLSSWLVAENVPYSAADVIATVETDKAVVDIEAEEEGVLLRRLVGEGASVAVGEPIALIGAAGEQAGNIEDMLRVLGVASGPAAGADAESAAAGRSDLVGSGAAADPAAARSPAQPPVAAVRGASPPSGTTSPALGDVPGNGQHGGLALQRETTRIFVSPIARRLAREAELDVTVISGTGPNGRIMRRDVEQAIRAAQTAPAETAPAETAPAEAAPAEAAPAEAAPSETAPAETAPAETAAVGARQPAGRASWAPTPARPDGPPQPARFTAVPHSRVRQAIASRMTESKQTVPHFYVTGSARADKLVWLRAELNDGPLAARVSVNDLVIKAVARAHQLVPAMNVIWTPEALLCYESVDIGVAIASPRGLVTPVLRAVEQASVSALAAAARDLADRAAAGHLQQRELEGGTTCVSNLGMFGVEEFSAIINPPQSSILAVGAVHDAPVVEQGELRVGSLLRVTLSADHRAVDGTTAAEWMKAFTGLIEHPVQILA